MKVKVKVTKEVELATLHVEAGVRYWEDGTVNGVADTEGTLIPCREGELWKPVIDINTGQIINWEAGKSADVHYKVCDCGSYFLKDAEGNTALQIDDDYVPNIMCPEERGYGDYIIMKINEGGFIKNWRIDINGFGQTEDFDQTED